jgi:DNA-binding response OmpR family regulator
MQTDAAGQSAGKPSVNPLVLTCCSQFDLSPAEGRALARLMKGDLVDRQELHAVITDKPGAIPKIVDVTICRLRQKLADHGIKIITRPGVGYRLDRNTRKLIAISHTEEQT